MPYKQVILVREDLKLPKGKLAAQSSHASVDATLKSDKKIVNSWKKEGAKKVILKVKSDFEDQLKYDYERGFGTASLAYPVKLINELGQAKTASVEMSGNEPESEIIM